MNDVFITRVRAAAVAGWWTVLVAVVFITLLWLVCLCLLATQPPCALRLCGPNITWPQFQHMCLWAIVVFKLGLWFGALIVLWLTLWARQLKRRAGTG
jgi:hypothetical protein